MKTLPSLRLLKVFSASCAVVLLLSACGSAPEGNNASPSEMPFVDIEKTVQDLLAKKEPIPADIEKAFYEYESQRVVDILLNTTETDPSEVQQKTKEIHDLFENFHSASTNVFTFPSDLNEFLKTKKEERKVCFIVKRSPPKEGDIGEYVVLRGNECDTKKIYQEAQKSAHDAIRITDLQTIKIEMEIKYVDNNEKYSKNISRLPKDPETGKDYGIFISPDEKKFCVSGVLNGKGADAKMANDDGNNPLLYEVGDGCKNL